MNPLKGTKGFYNRLQGVSGLLYVSVPSGVPLRFRVLLGLLSGFL